MEDERVLVGCSDRYKASASEVGKQVQPGPPFELVDRSASAYGILRLEVLRCFVGPDPIQLRVHQTAVCDVAFAQLQQIDRAFEDLELRDRLDKALAQLPSAVRFMVSAHYLGGQKYEDLAQALDLPIGTLKAHLHPAKRRLRTLPEGDDDRPR